MSVHFFYNYKEELVKKLGEQFKEKLEIFKQEEFEMQQLVKAENIIYNYFEDLGDQLTDIIKASNGNIGFESGENVIKKFFIGDNYIKFTWKERSIELKLGVYNEEDKIVEESIACYVVPGSKKCKLKKVGQIHDGSSFDENTINYYMQMVFEEI